MTNYKIINDKYKIESPCKNFKILLKKFKNKSLKNDLNNLSPNRDTNYSFSKVTSR